MQNETALRALEQAAIEVVKEREKLQAVISNIAVGVRMLSKEVLIDLKTGQLVGVEPEDEPPPPVAASPPSATEEDAHYDDPFEVKIEDEQPSVAEEPQQPPEPPSEPPVKPEPKASNGRVGAGSVQPTWKEKPNAVEAEQRRAKIIKYLISAGRECFPQDIAKDLNIQRHSQVSEDLRMLISRGVNLAVKENFGRPRGVKIGRFSNAYLAMEDTKYIDPDGGELDPFSLREAVRSGS